MNVTEKDLKTVERAKTFEDAQIAAVAVLTKMNHKDTPMKPEKVSYLTRQISGARSKMDLVQMMYNAYLSGEGLATVSSGYQKRF